MSKHKLLLKEYADKNLVTKTELKDYIESSKFNNITGMRAVQIITEINGANFFDVARAENEYILPLFFGASAYICGFQYSNSSVRFIVDKNVTGYYNFVYLILYVN